MRARYYDSETGRFISRDPIGVKGGLNLYEYCGNEPIRNIDKFGTDFWVEGPSSSADNKEPAGHQSICVGDPNGEYTSYSFGVNWNVSWYGLQGEVYKDTTPGGEIRSDLYSTSTKEEDAAMKNSLESQNGQTGSYNILNTCRNYSQNQYSDFSSKYGTSGTAPDRDTSGNPSSGPGITSSSVTSGERYGPTSSSTSSTKKRCKKK